MKHPTTEHISSWLDRETSQEASHQIEGHMAECEKCLEKAHELGTVRKELRELPRVQASLNFDSIRKRVQRRNSWQKVIVPIGIAACVLLMVSAAIPMLIAGPSPILASMSGGVWIEHTPGAGWEEAMKGEAITTGVQIRLAEDGQVDITLSSKYEIRVKGEALMTAEAIRTRGQNGKFVFFLKQGTLLAKTEKEFKGSSLTILTPSAKAKAMGTAFAVQVSSDALPMTWLGVLQGHVEVERLSTASRVPLIGKGSDNRVLVGAGQSTHVRGYAKPTSPDTILDPEWRVLQELYQLGYSTRIVLLVSPTERRVSELMRPCGIYFSEREGHGLSSSLRLAIAWSQDALASGHVESHQKSIRNLKRVIKQQESLHDITLMLFVGAYEYYIDDNEAAIETFRAAIERGRQSSLASLALCAIGMIQEEQGNRVQAEETYWKVLQDYPGSLEQKEARKGIERLSQKI
jgi:ferric-dicitrate binding protein FerR (iron transport regulator)